MKRYLVRVVFLLCMIPAWLHAGNIPGATEAIRRFLVSEGYLVYQASIQVGVVQKGIRWWAAVSVRQKNLRLIVLFNEGKYSIRYAEYSDF